MANPTAQDRAFLIRLKTNKVNAAKDILAQEQQRVAAAEQAVAEAEAELQAAQR